MLPNKKIIKVKIGNFVMQIPLMVIYKKKIVAHKLVLCFIVTKDAYFSQKQNIVT